MGKLMAGFCDLNKCRSFFSSEEEGWKDLAVVLFFSSGFITYS